MATKTKTLKKKWLVVLFDSTKEYSVLPVNWLLEPIIGSIERFCYWPNYRVTSKELREAKAPDSDWLTYKIKIVGGNTTSYDNFNKAWHTQVEVETETENEDIQNKKKRESTSSASTIDDGFDNSPYAKPEVISFTEFVVKNSRNFLPADNVLPLTPVTPDQSSLLLQSHSNPQYIQSSSNQFLTSRSLGQEQANTSLPLSTSLNETNISTLQRFTEVPDFHQSRDPTLRMILNRILLKVENIERILSLNKDGTTSLLLDQKFLSMFPIDNPEGYMLVQTCILNELDFASKLEYFIKSIGGRDSKEHTIRALSKLMTDRYAGQCTWTGRGKNISTKVGHTELMKIISKVVKSNSKIPVTDSDVETEIAQWLRRANTRLKRVVPLNINSS